MTLHPAMTDVDRAIALQTLPPGGKRFQVWTIPAWRSDLPDVLLALLTFRLQVSPCSPTA